MKRLFLALGLLLGFCAPGLAQVPCIGIAGVNSVPQPGPSCPQEPAVATFGAAGYGIVPAASATDVACITGAANVVVRVQRIVLSGTAGTAVVLPADIQYHTTADTGGTAATTTALPVPYAVDGGSATAAKATTTAYTANPTINDATTRQIAVKNLALTTTSTLTGVNPETVFDWSNHRYAEAPTLRTAAQQVCVNLTGISVSSGLMNVSFLWTEAVQ